MIGALIAILVVAMLIAVLYFLGYVSFGKPQKDDACVPGTYSLNATQYKIDDKSNCVVSNCASGFTLSGGVCVADTPSKVANDPCIPTTYVEGGKDYKEIKNSDGTFTCKPTACSALYEYLDNDCTKTGIVAPDPPAAGDSCIPEAYVTYGNSYTYGADATTCELAGCSDSYVKINGKCMTACSAAGIPALPIEHAVYYRLPGEDDTDDNCAPLACATDYTATTDASGAVTECTQSTEEYTPRRSGYNMRYNSKKLEGVRL